VDWAWRIGHTQNEVLLELDSCPTAVVAESIAVLRIEVAVAKDIAVGEVECSQTHRDRTVAVATDTLVGSVENIGDTHSAEVVVAVVASHSERATKRP